MSMRNITYHIDRYEVYRGFLLVEGWAYARNAESQLQIIALSLEIELDGLVNKSPRPDVVSVHPDAPLQCGFTLRVIIPVDIDVMQLRLCIRYVGAELIIDRPWDSVVARAYAPLETLNRRFFNTVKTANQPNVLEIGARARSGITRKELFGESAKYIGLDIKEGENVDVVGDAHLLSTYFDSCSVDFAYSVSVFEHIMWPWKVAIELGKVMKLNGLILMQSHPVWPKHEVPWDFFRFWDSGWRALFCRETGFEVIETVEAHPVELVPSPFTGSYVHYWQNSEATLASSVLARKIAEPSVEWSAIPRLESLGIYPG